MGQGSALMPPSADLAGSLEAEGPLLQGPLTQWQLLVGLCCLEGVPPPLGGLLSPPREKVPVLCSSFPTADSSWSGRGWVSVLTLCHCCLGWP